MAARETTYSTEEPDPWHQGGQDPWSQSPTTSTVGATTPQAAAQAQKPPQQEEARSSFWDNFVPTRRSFAGVTEGRAEDPSVPHEAPPQRIIHDIPPAWSGENPEKQLEPCLKFSPRLVDDHQNPKDPTWPGDSTIRHGRLEGNHQ